ncbi:hypothetical protein [Maribacter sp. LLG6340-A2]|uniref:hypothetical protein n=1 Tax=Maribacter sp. LLG6340-A2 TaxID=3160834 RepID=UPI0038662BBC
MSMFHTHYKKVYQTIFLLSSLLLFTSSLLYAQSNMPNDSYTIITEATNLGPENPRRSSSMLGRLKQKFYTDGSYENIDDFSVYYTIVAAEAEIHVREGKFSTVYRLFGELGDTIKPLRTKDDQYASYYYFSKVMILLYKAWGKGGLLEKNPRYRGEIKALIEEVKRFNFKEKINQNLVVSHLEQYL